MKSYIPVIVILSFLGWLTGGVNGAISGFIETTCILIILTIILMGYSIIVYFKERKR